MNIILAEAAEIADGRLTLTDHRAEHIVRVLRAAIGDRLRIGVINGRRGIGTVAVLQSRPSLSVTLALELPEPVGEMPPIDLILALPRPIMLKRILSQVTALGVGTIHLINAKRVEKSFWEAGLLLPDEYRVHLRHGLEQAVDTRMPEVRLHPRFRPFIEDFFPPLAAAYRFLVVADPTGDRRLTEAVAGNGGRIVLAVGPEGGWVAFEVEKFRELGFSCCSIGPRILKVDTAVIALHAAITALREAGGGAAAHAAQR
jgi:16S rRNA (uracil1498-N3)-methyltransferase